MISDDFRYCKGGQESREKVELDIMRGDGAYITTCVVDVDLLVCGIDLHSCRNEDDLKLDLEQQLKVLEFVLAERKKITETEAVKSLEGWRESGLHTFEDYCFPGDIVDEAMVEYFVNSVPPVLTLSFCTQAGEVFNYEEDMRGAHRPTFTTFHELGGGRWQFDGYCFYKENTNRCVRKSRLEERIDEARRKLV